MPYVETSERDVVLATITALERSVDRLARANEIIASVARPAPIDYGPALAALAPSIQLMVEIYAERLQKLDKKR